MRLEDARRDPYRRLAREQGYKSRAAYKLQEAIRKYGLIRDGDAAVDLGAAPGGWLQVASETVGPRGLVIGVDLKPMKVELENAKTVQMDITNDSLVETLRSLLPSTGADAVFADLAPKITGAWDLDHYVQIDLTLRALAIARLVLRHGGNGMLKVFDGERLAEIRTEAARLFEKVFIMKPRASRKESSELYLVCLKKR